MTVRGQLIVVGSGMMLGAHLTPRSRAFLVEADVVFVAVTDALTEQWLASINPRIHSFASLYQVGKPRSETYQQMVELILAAVRQQQKVVAVFYGHPGVFAQVAHMALSRVHAEGFSGHMEPGISAADCLHADLQIDPATYGCTYMEASQLMFYQRMLDPTSYVILWQVALAGDLSISQLESRPCFIQLLVTHLKQWYPAQHPIILYEAASLPFQTIRRQSLVLDELPEAELSLKTTLVIPPAKPLQANVAMVRQLKQLQVDSV